MYEIEDITESMNEQGDPGTWYSVIHNTNMYRVLEDGEEDFIFTEDDVLSEDDELYHTIIPVLNVWKEMESE